MRRPLDPGYAAAARRREEQRTGQPPGAVGGERRRPGGSGAWTGPERRSHHRFRPTATVVAVGVLLGLASGAGIAQLRSGPLEAQDRAVLEAEVERRTSVADQLAENNAALRLDIEAEQAAAIGEGAERLLADTERLALLTGAVPAVGDGVQVVLDDAPVDDVTGEGGFGDDSRVRDTDVQTVVNGLWAAGAEGVAVNGQRLTSLATIRHAGDAIVVDLRQLARPYTITAIGDPDLLLAEVQTGAAGRYLGFLRDSYGISVSVEEVEDASLPAASRLSLRHATGVVEERAPDEPQEESSQ